MPFQFAPFPSSQIGTFVRRDCDLVSVTLVMVSVLVSVTAWTQDDPWD